jgi:hypothetical protein
LKIVWRISADFNQRVSRILRNFLAGLFGQTEDLAMQIKNENRPVEASGFFPKGIQGRKRSPDGLKIISVIPQRGA